MNYFCPNCKKHFSQNKLEFHPGTSVFICPVCKVPCTKKNREITFSSTQSSSSLISILKNRYILFIHHLLYGYFLLTFLYYFIFKFHIDATHAIEHLSYEKIIYNFFRCILIISYPFLYMSNLLDKNDALRIQIKVFHFLIEVILFSLLIYDFITLIKYF